MRRLVFKPGHSVNNLTTELDPLEDGELIEAVIGNEVCTLQVVSDKNTLLCLDCALRSYTDPPGSFCGSPRSCFGSSVCSWSGTIFKKPSDVMEEL